MDILTRTEDNEKIYFKIFINLSFEDLLNCRLVNSHWKNLSSDSKILLRKIEEEQERYTNSSTAMARRFAAILDSWTNISEQWLKIQSDPKSVANVFKILPKPYLRNGPFKETLAKCLLKFHNTNQFDWIGVGGSSAVTIAAQVGDVQFMKFLLYIMKEEPITSSSPTLGRPIMTAIENGHFEIVRTLVEYTNEPLVYDFHGNSSIDLAKKFGFHEIASYLKNCSRTMVKSTKSKNNKDKMMLRLLGSSTVIGLHKAKLLN